MLNVLIACEESQVECMEFRKLGFNAYSCDIQPCSGGHDEWHIQCDVTQLLKMDWDLIIAHPPCTYLSNAGACRLYPKKGQLNEECYRQGLKAKEFFMLFYHHPCARIAIENPVPSRVFEMPEKSQVIQPYQFGEPWSKKTYLWLKGLPPLKPTEVLDEYHPYICGNSDIWKRMAEQGTFWGKEKSQKHRSRSFAGIAKAMAEQWGAYLKEMKNNDSN